MTAAVALSRAFALRGNIHLPAALSELQTSYQSAEPVQHLSIDQLFADEFLVLLREELRDEPQDLLWHGPRMRQFVDIVHSAAFLFMLSEITQIWQLLPDPYLHGAGYTCRTRRGVDQSVPFTGRATPSGMVRRFAMVVFLSAAWKPEYCGHLQFWNPGDPDRKIGVAPLFNRTVIFELSDSFRYQYLMPFNGPSDALHESIMLFYHTAGNEETAGSRPVSSLFAAASEQRRALPTSRQVLRNTLPPFLTRLLRKWF